MPRESAGADDETKEQDRLLPIANVARIMKRALPENAKIAKDAKECVQECVSEFIAFVTSEASDRCAQEKRKTVNGDDILWAMQSLGFENYNETLKLYLQKYRETTKMEKGAINAKDEQQADAQHPVQSLNQHAAPPGGVEMSQAYLQQLQMHNLPQLQHPGGMAHAGGGGEQDQGYVHAGMQQLIPGQQMQQSGVPPGQQGGQQQAFY
ncbi:hypothetical protein HK101_007439 [Irineochytrium annulatum]|nr:hypothetical protein HK101_007439 [Irineochytrium annulatum]